MGISGWRPIQIARQNKTQCLAMLMICHSHPRARGQLDDSLAGLVPVGPQFLNPSLTNHCLVTKVSAGQALWVPYGWDRSMITRCEGVAHHVSYVRCAPYMAAHTIQGCPIKAALFGFVERVAQGTATHGKAPWNMLGPELQVWRSDQDRKRNALLGQTRKALQKHRRSGHGCWSLCGG